MKNEIDILDTTGHTRVIWDSSVKAEVDNAKATFDSMLAKGYKAFSVKKDGSEGEQIKKFDPDAEKMILMPAIQGG